ncbi:MAG: SIMPL domain-containing protein [Rickettsiales bacterium]|jgi:uncharacterized protein YggE|nr:SIMPL domain-containing protein [Rickettsiales bacterium]
MKKTYKIASAICGGILLIAAACAICGRGEIRYVSVSGECFGTAEKDRTAINLRIITLDKNAGESLRAANSLANMTAETVKNLARQMNDESLQMQTQQFDSYEKTEWNSKAQKSVSLGFETSIAIEVSTENRKTIENILTWLSSQTKIHPENLRMFSSPAKLKAAQEACIETAVANARARAESLARAEGDQVGKMLSAEYSKAGYVNQSRQVLRMAKGINFEEAAGANLQAQDTEITVQVSAEFELR